MGTVHPWPPSGLTRDLGRGPIGLAPDVFVYFVEGDPGFLSLVGPIFDGLDRGRWQAVTSALTLIETLLGPCRAADMELADRYESLLRGCRGLRLVELDRPLLTEAARLRERYFLEPPAAIQLAAALSAGCTAFVTNRRAFPEVPELRVLRLDRYRRPS